MTRPDFLVFSALVKDEETQGKSCFIVLESSEDATAFADYLENKTILAVEAVIRPDEFFFTFGKFYQCAAIKVHIKEERKKFRLDCEQIAIAETYSYIAQRDLLNR